MEDFISCLFSSSDYFYTKLFLLYLLICRVVTYFQQTPLTFHYNKKNALMEDFLAKSAITKLVYKPYFVAFTPIVMFINYILYEAFTKICQPQKFERETLTLSDGGTVGIAWSVEKDGSGKPKLEGKGVKPILLIAPGLGGGADNLYSTALVDEARKQGYKVGTILFRCADGLPITSGKLSYSGCWEDCKAIIDHVHQKYVQGPKPDERRTRLYAFGCSLGANIVGLQLCKEGKKASSKLDGALLYGAPWSIKNGSEFFYKNMGGAYQKAIGLNLSADIRQKHLPQLKKYLSTEHYTAYKTALDNNWSGLDTIDRQVYAPMFGFKDEFDYYDKVDIAKDCLNIKVPTFAVEAIDDPICGHQFIPFDKLAHPESNIMIGATQRGAHVCHIEGHLFPTGTWYPQPFMEFLNFMESRTAAKSKDD